MSKIDWLSFINLFPFMVLGLIVHILKQLNKAKSRPDYSLNTFMKMNWLGYIIAIIVSTTLLMMLSAGVELMPNMNEMLVSFTLGVTGGSLFRRIRTK